MTFLAPTASLALTLASLAPLPAAVEATAGPRGSTRTIAAADGLLERGRAILRRETPSLWDLDGELPSAGGLVFPADALESGGAIPALSGLQPTEREGWLFVRTDSPAARDPAVLRALGRAAYVAPAAIDRLGGFAWPTASILVHLRPEATPADEARALGAARSIAKSERRFSAIPRLLQLDLDLRDGRDVLAAVARIAADPAVEFAEPDVSHTGVGHFIPDDPGFDLCWGLLNTGQGAGQPGFDMRVTEAWTTTIGSVAFPVLVIDVGVDSTHNDLTLLPGRDFTTGSAQGVPGGDPVNACDNHGTPVAGCISATLGNDYGTVGVAPGSPSVSARCFVAQADCEGGWTGSFTWTANALNWALANGIRVTNNSNGYGSSSAAVGLAYRTLRENGVVHFASAGNTGNTSITYPASLDVVNAIGAADRFGNRADFSSYGAKLAVLGAGEAIYTTDRAGSAGWEGGDFTLTSGTSFASPYVAGIAALLLTRNPSLTPDQLDAILRATARDMGDPGFDILTGWGLVDAAAALAAAADPADIDGDGAVGATDLSILLGVWGTCPSGAPCPADLTGDGSVDAADLATLIGSWG